MTQTEQQGRQRPPGAREFEMHRRYRVDVDVRLPDRAGRMDFTFHR